MSSISDYLNYAYSFKCAIVNIVPSQIEYEIFTLLKLLYKVKPRIICEIGTAKGGTLFLFSRILGEEACLISIDLPGGKFGGGYHEWKIPIYRSFIEDDVDLHLVRADSHSQECVKHLEEILEGRMIDFLFIDGDHTYEGVRQDFENYKNLVNSKGIIAFHDIVHHPLVPACKVDRYWNEIKRDYKSIDIIESRDQTWAGIGVLFMDQETYNWALEKLQT